MLDAVLQHRSVSQAARQLGRSQPAVSHALARLRDHLGDPLLVREGGGMVPTPRGAALEAPLARILADLRQVLADGGRFDPSSSQRRFLLSCPDMLAPLLPALLKALSAAPGVDLELRSRPEPTADVVIGRLDRAPGSWRARGVGRVEQTVVMRHDHPALNEVWTVESWLRWPHILVRTGDPEPSIVDHAVTAAGHTRRLGLVVPSFLSAVEVVSHTDFFFTGAAAAFDHLQVAVAHRPPPLPLPALPVAVTWPQRLDADPGHRWFRERVAAVVGAALG